MSRRHRHAVDAINQARARLRASIDERVRKLRKATAERDKLEAVVQRETALLNQDHREAAELDALKAKLEAPVGSVSP